VGRVLKEKKKQGHMRSRLAMFDLESTEVLVGKIKSLYPDEPKIETTPI
jgi:hypothetical protein